MNKSTSLDLIEKSFNSELKGEWIGMIKIQLLFVESYIIKHYSKLLHYIRSRFYYKYL